MVQWDGKTREIWGVRGKRKGKEYVEDTRLSSVQNLIPHTELSACGEAHGVTEERFYDALYVNTDASMA